MPAPMSTTRPRKVDDPARDVSWMKQAACVGQDPETWHPVGTSGPAVQQEQVAKQVCDGCSVARACLAWSLLMGLEHGIYGGLNAEERRSVKQQLRQERRQAVTA